MADDERALPDYPFAYTAGHGFGKYVRVQRGEQNESTIRNTKVWERSIRIQLLDCRSGRPLEGVPVEGVRIVSGGTEYNYKRFVAGHEDARWDIGEHFPIYESGGTWYRGKRPIAQGTDLKRRAQVALKELGFYFGRIDGDFGNGGKRAWLLFQMHALSTLSLPDIQACPADDDAKEPECKEFDEAHVKQIRSYFETIKLRSSALQATLAVVATIEKGDEGVERQVIALDPNGGNDLEVREPTAAELQTIVDHYNARCYRTAKLHLALQGFVPDGVEDPLSDSAMDASDDWKWTAPWIAAFRVWQKTAMPGRTDARIVDRVLTKADGERLRETGIKNGCGITNDEGMVRIPIPLAEFDEAFSVKIKFADYPIVPEATQQEIEGKNNGEGLVSRWEARLGPTGFSVEWVDEQTAQPNAWDQLWGWRLGPQRSKTAEERSAFAQFKTSATFEIPEATTAIKEAAAKHENVDGTNKAVGLLRALHRAEGTFSKYYFADDDPEFVVFGLVWCQPVWDGIEPPENQDISYQSYVQDKDEVISHMHLATKYSGSRSFGKKLPYISGAGAYRQNAGTLSDRPHLGADLYALEDSHFIFAVHAGTATFSNWTENSSSGADGGKIATMDWTGGFGSVQYLHLHSYESALHGKRVKAGTKLGKTGRTGNLGWKYKNGKWNDVDLPYPTHTHINGGTSGENLKLRTKNFANDDPNRFCIPSNSTPLVFPCVIEEEENKDTLKTCQFAKHDDEFKNQTILNSCWAAQELACPYMHKSDKSRDVLRMQAQLRYLFKKDHATYTSPGTKLSGDLGATNGGTVEVKKDETIALLKVLSENPTVLRVEANGVKGKVDYETFKDDVTVGSGEYTAKQDFTITLEVEDLSNTVGADAEAEAGATRLAIYNFKKAHGLLADTPPASETNSANYEIGDAITRLNKEAKVRRPAASEQEPG